MYHYEFIRGHFENLNTVLMNNKNLFLNKKLSAFVISVYKASELWLITEEKKNDSSFSQLFIWISQILCASLCKSRTSKVLADILLMSGHCVFKSFYSVQLTIKVFIIVACMCWPCVVLKLSCSHPPIAGSVAQIHGDRHNAKMLYYLHRNRHRQQYTSWHCTAWQSFWLENGVEVVCRLWLVKTGIGCSSREMQNQHRHLLTSKEDSRLCICVYVVLYPVLRPLKALSLCKSQPPKGCSANRY